MRRSILSINSNKFMNYLLHTILSTDYNLICVQDVYQGMQELKENNDIGLVIVDTDLHPINCLHFIQHLQTSWLYYKPVIVLTSNNEDPLNASLIEANVHEIFTKPFSPRELLTSVTECMTAPSSAL